MRIHNLYKEHFVKTKIKQRLNLDQIQSVYESLHPNNQSNYFLVGGTNGKGSTSAFLFRLLALSGKSTCLYSSPHIRSYMERFHHSHSTLSENKVCQYFLQAAEHTKNFSFKNLSYFELLTLAAIGTFKEAQADETILEVGLGGRLDATNIVDPICSIVTSVGLDHQEWLGDCQNKILKEKLPIARPSKPLFFGEISLDSESEETLQRMQQEIGFILFRYGSDFEVKENQMTLTSNKGKIQLPLPTWFQNRPTFLKRNFCLSSQSFLWYMEQKQASLEEIQKTFIAFDQSLQFWPPSLLGRCQWVPLNHEYFSKVLLDVGHNIQAIEGLVAFIKQTYPNQKLPGLLTIFQDKAVVPMIELLQEILSPLILFKVDHERSITADVLPAHLRSMLRDNFQMAFNELSEYASQSSSKKPLVVCGSFLAVGGALDYFQHQNIVSFESPHDLLRTCAFTSSKETQQAILS